MYEDLFEELFSSPEPSDCDPDSGDESEDTGNRRKWDPHAGMKPSCQHGHASDDEVDLEVELPYRADAKVNDAMVNLMWELDDDDPCDVEWLPAKMRRPEPGIKGAISSSDRRS